MDKIGLRQVLPDVFADNPPVGSEIWRRDVTFDKGRVYLVEAASGSGKSSFCGYLYGYRRDYSGTILFDDRDIRELSVGEWSGLRCRSLAMMFQGLRLFPELSAVDNVRLKNNLTGRRSEAEIAWLFEALGIAEKRETSVSKLSFGQQQRVAIARSLVNQPRVLLLDEPLGALDLKLRKEMQLELKRLQREMNITFVYVTHDQEEALTMSDTVVVMNKGNIQQIGSPQDIYNEPRNAFVAKFIGDSNIVDGIMEKDFLVSFGGQEFACVDRGFKPREPVQVVIRPEDVDIVPPSAGKLTGLVREVIFKGVHFEMHVDVEGKEWLIHSTQASQPGELIGMNIGPDEIHIMSREEV